VTATFKDQPWSSRYSKMGDQAEAIFEEVCPRKWARHGLNRPPIQVGALPLKIRYEPDYITSTAFVEVQGFGRGQELQMKVEKYVGLCMWHEELNVELFLFDSSKKRWTIVGLDDVTAVIASSELGVYPEGKPYFKTPIRNLEADWTKYVAAT
jgi:hypothetical protein